MKHDFASNIIDPNDGSTLALHVFEGGDSDVREGVLRNEETGRWFPIRDGIPSVFADALRTGGMAAEDAAFNERYVSAMLNADCRAPEESKPAAEAAGQIARIESERKARDEQSEDYDRMMGLKVLGKIEIPAYRKALENADRALPLLEAGCGTGRFTGVFAELGSSVVAADLSRDSIERNRVRWAGRTASPVHYLHCDLTHLPLRSGMFGSCAHCGVYEHIPTREMREQFLTHAARSLTPDGKLLLSAYRWGGMTKLFGKEGEHDGGIPFFRFTEEELRAEVETEFEITSFRANLGIYMSMVAATPKKK